MTSKAVYYDSSRAASVLNATVAVLGYGSQGRAQALNLKDSGLHVKVGNISDRYVDIALADGFQTLAFEEAVRDADFVLMLVPDHAQGEIYQKIETFLKSGSLLLVSHGFSLNYGKIKPRSDLDVGLLAPRMPGVPIREAFLDNHGVPAFYGVITDYSGSCENKVLALADNLGYTKTGILETNISEETEVDLFIEQFMLPRLMHLLEETFLFLVDAGVTPEIAHLETYSSGELSDLLRLAANEGLYNAWKNHASPTCRFGLSQGISRAEMDTDYWPEMQRVLDCIRDGSFVEELDHEYLSGMETLTKFDLKNEKRLLSVTQNSIAKLFK